MPEIIVPPNFTYMLDNYSVLIDESALLNESGSKLLFNMLSYLNAHNRKLYMTEDSIKELSIRSKDVFYGEKARIALNMIVDGPDSDCLGIYSSKGSGFGSDSYVELIEKTVGNADILFITNNTARAREVMNFIPASIKHGRDIAVMRLDGKKLAFYTATDRIKEMSPDMMREMKTSHLEENNLQKPAADEPVSRVSTFVKAIAYLLVLALLVYAYIQYKSP